MAEINDLVEAMLSVLFYVVAVTSNGAEIAFEINLKETKIIGMRTAVVLYIYSNENDNKSKMRKKKKRRWREVEGIRGA